MIQATTTLTRADPPQLSLQAPQLLLLSADRLMLAALATVALDPVAQALAGHPEALRHFADLVAPIGDLFHRLDLEFFRVAFPAHIHTFWFALV